MTIIQAGAGLSLASAGKISFVGAGPGDAGLLTRRASDLLGRADVVVADYAAFGAIIEELCPATVRIIDAPQEAKSAEERDSSNSSELIEEIGPGTLTRAVIRLAQDGARIVRLLAGDGLSDATLHTELATCQEHGVTFEMVPGISLASTVPMYSGWSLAKFPDSTTRVVDVNRNLGVATRLVPDPNSALILHGHADRIVAAMPSLQLGGYSKTATVVVLSKLATLQQKSIRSTLVNLGRDIRTLPDKEKLVAIIGSETGFDGYADWFEGRALFGWKILAPTTQLGLFHDPDWLTSHGATVTTIPTIVVGPPRTDTPIKRAITGLVTGRYQWVGFTSSYSLRSIRERLLGLGLDARALAGVRIATIPGETEAALRSWGIEPDLIGPGPGTRGLLETWPSYSPESDPLERVLLPRAEIDVDSLAAGLRERGWLVDDVMAYRTMRAAPPEESIRNAIKHGEFDAVLFNSAAGVRNLVGIAGKPHPTTVIACIGPATMNAAVELGLRVDVVAAEPSFEAMMSALVTYASQRRSDDLAAGRNPRRPSDSRRARRGETTASAS